MKKWNGNKSYIQKIQMDIKGWKINDEWIGNIQKKHCFEYILWGAVGTKERQCEMEEMEV